MPVVEFVDTSVLLNILDVPNRNGRRDLALSEQKAKRDAGTQFILPVTTVIETGNAKLPSDRRCGLAAETQA